DTETIGEARAQALADLVLGDSQAHVNLDVVIDLATLLRLREDPATLPGSGPIAADEARDLLATLPPDAQVTLRRLVADPLTGHLLDAGRTRYRIPDQLRRFITARDGTCRFPGCARRADRCQVDHATPWDHGGATSRANLGALCTRHHQLKTHAGWQITASAADGTCTWQSPLGRTHPHAPPDIRGSG
ncbi:MAG: HNH endonuclease signature motif containing protein, partial [Actinomycetota bacterium]|nr:HNH endonuclease signature motif containing protein [Actinomycetota bacterium]